LDLFFISKIEGVEFGSDGIRGFTAHRGIYIPSMNELLCIVPLALRRDIQASRDLNTAIACMILATGCLAVYWIMIESYN
jgi:hypothetical protein